MYLFKNPMIVYKITPFILSFIFLMYTEYISDCSVITNNRIMTSSLLFLSFCPLILSKYSLKLQKFICIFVSFNVLITLCLLWLNRTRVHKFVIFNDFSELKPSTNDIFVCFKLSPPRKEKSNIKDEIEIFKKTVYRLVKNRVNEDLLIINFDFCCFDLSNLKNLIHYNSLINSIYFSKYGRNILFYLKIAFAEMSNMHLVIDLIHNRNLNNTVINTVLENDVTNCLNNTNPKNLMDNNDKTSQFLDNKLVKNKEILEIQNMSFNLSKPSNDAEKPIIPTPPPMPTFKITKKVEFIKPTMLLEKKFTFELKEKFNIFLKKRNVKNIEDGIIKKDEKIFYKENHFERPKLKSNKSNVEIYKSFDCKKNIKSLNKILENQETSILPSTNGNEDKNSFKLSPVYKNTADKEKKVKSSKISKNSNNQISKFNKHRVEPAVQPSNIAEMMFRTIKEKKIFLLDEDEKEETIEKGDADDLEWNDVQNDKSYINDIIRNKSFLRGTSHYVISKNKNTNVNNLKNFEESNKNANKENLYSSNIFVKKRSKKPDPEIAKAMLKRRSAIEIEDDVSISDS